jgi:RHS repeat-associated protein
MAFGLATDTTGQASLSFADMAVESSDGTVRQIFNGQPVGLTAWSENNSPASPSGVFTTTPPAGSTASADQAAATHFYTGDHLGTTQIELAAGGWPVWSGQFAPFGAELDTQATAMHYKFTGKERDQESGLDYFGARYYSSVIGRFSSPDDGRDQSPGDPQSWNLYSYVRNNPLSDVDPDGHLDCSSGGAAPAATNAVLNGVASFFHSIACGVAGLFSGGSSGSSNTNVSVTIHPDYWPNDYGRQVAMALGQQAPGAMKMIEAQSVIAAASVAPMALLEAGGAGTTLDMAMVNSSEIDTAAADAESPFNQYLSKGARSLDKKIGRGDSAFERGGNPGQIVRDIMSKATRVVRKGPMTDIYDATGRGVRIDSGTHKFVTFLEERLASR